VERNNVSERYSDDADWATAAEQSSEDDEAQEGNILSAEEKASSAAEREAVHLEDDGEESNEEGTEDIDIDDPEADAIVNDALNLDETAETEAAAEVLNDSTAEEAADLEAAAADEVAPYDGPDPSTELGTGVNGDEDADAQDDSDEDAEEDPYEAFRMDLRMMPGKWYVIHSYAGFERKVKANIEQRKSTLEVEDDIYQVEVPMEDVVEIKNGQRKMVTRVRIPGYVLVRMELNEDTWSVVRHTPGVTDAVALRRGLQHAQGPRRGQGRLHREERPVQGRRRRRPPRRRRGGLRDRRDHHDQGGLVRGPARFDQRDQARERQAHGARLPVRARDPGRAVVRPGHQDDLITLFWNGRPSGRPFSFPASARNRVDLRGLCARGS
jgi:hypothetical protein